MSTNMFCEFFLRNESFTMIKEEMMKMKKLLFGTVLFLILILSVSTAQASTVFWTDWTASGPGEVTGTMSIGAETVGVTFSGSYSFAQVSGGTNYWNPATPYLSATVENAPPASDIIALSSGGSVTITFSQAVTNPLLALVSWNGNHPRFENEIEFLSYGYGYWGGGTPVMDADKKGFLGNGEVHGVLQMAGTYDAITFTHTSEGWHGLTVGVVDVAPVPLPAALWLFGSGLVGLVGLRRKIGR